MEGRECDGIMYVIMYEQTPLLSRPNFRSQGFVFTQGSTVQIIYRIDGSGVLITFFVGFSGNGWSSCCQKSCWCYFGNDQGNNYNTSCSFERLNDVHEIIIIVFTRFVSEMVCQY